MALLIILCGLTAGLAEGTKLRMRSRELAVLSDALSAMKSAAEYTAGDLSALLQMCGENAFLQHVSVKDDPVWAWKAAASDFFTNASDKVFAERFIDGYGKTDLDGLLAYIALYEEKTARRLKQAEGAVTAKCKLYAVLGFFFGTATALLLI